MKTTTVGEATIKLVKLKELINLYEKHLKEDPTPFYTT